MLAEIGAILYRCVCTCIARFTSIKMQIPLGAFCLMVCVSTGRVV